MRSPSLPCPHCTAQMDRRTVQTFAGSIGNPPEYASGYECTACGRSYDADDIEFPRVPTLHPAPARKAAA